MKISTTLVRTAAVAVLALAATELSASAQDLTKGANGMQPHKMPLKTMAGRQPSRMAMKPHAMHRQMSFRYGHRPMHYAATRPLVVRPAAPLVTAGPVVAGPGTLVTGPLAFGSDIAALPFRGLDTIFPATGDVASNPLVLIGGPLHAAGDLAQIPFRLIGAPFGGTSIATY